MVYKFKQLSKKYLNFSFQFKMPFPALFKAVQNEQAGSEGTKENIAGLRYKSVDATCGDDLRRSRNSVTQQSYTFTCWLGWQCRISVFRLQVSKVFSFFLLTEVIIKY